MLTIGVVVLGTTDMPRAQMFWRTALGYDLREDGFGGWSTVLEPPGGASGTRIALQRSATQPHDYPRLHLDLHVADAAEPWDGKLLHRSDLGDNDVGVGYSFAEYCRSIPGGHPEL